MELIIEDAVIVTMAAGAGPADSMLVRDVLDKNPLEAEPVQITDIQVLATVLDGTPVCQSAGIFPEG